MKVVQFWSIVPSHNYVQGSHLFHNFDPFSTAEKNNKNLLVSPGL